MRKIRTILALIALLFMCVVVSAQNLPTSDNPIYNTSINPKYNTSINPKYNTSINPKYNTSINPKYNTSINPKYNSQLNPSKSGWNGFYLYNTDGNAVGAVVISDSKYMVYFNGNLEWKGFFSSNSKSGFNWFDAAGEWIGYLIPNGKSGFNLFSIDGEWIGFLA